MNFQNEKIVTTLTKIHPLDLSLTLDCGQSFRWAESDDGRWHAVVKNKSVFAEIQGDDLLIYGDDDEAFWRAYFDLDRDYNAICNNLSSDKWLNKAIEAYPGIRILKQEPWETLCSFIISQNNNIPRIKGIISRLCCLLGDDLGDGDFTFPSAEVIAQKSVEDLTPLRAGFRAKYIIDAAKKVTSGEVSFKKIASASMDEARAELQKISGVGPKVAECALLYGFGRVEAFPVDVWVRRIMQELYPEGLPEVTQGVEGVAQQYLFHWRRNVENPFEV
ncbi:MAG: DNA-3-methyladenine glycosylase 2 family protein [Clostridia bacterium]|nr:DNA-3-methyladenine glycosylase 2 family protein [Clostridia bacterium]